MVVAARHGHLPAARVAAAATPSCVDAAATAAVTCSTVHIHTSVPPSLRCAAPPQFSLRTAQGYSAASEPCGHMDSLGQADKCISGPAMSNQLQLGPTSELLSMVYPLPAGNLTKVVVSLTGPLNLTLVAPDAILELATGVDAAYNSSMIFGKEIAGVLGGAPYTPHSPLVAPFWYAPVGAPIETFPPQNAGYRKLDAHTPAQGTVRLASLRHVGAAAAAAAALGAAAVAAADAAGRPRVALADATGELHGGLRGGGEGLRPRGLEVGSQALMAGCRSPTPLEMAGGGAMSSVVSGQRCFE